MNKVGNRLDIVKFRSEYSNDRFSPPSFKVTLKFALNIMPVPPAALLDCLGKFLKR